MNAHDTGIGHPAQALPRRYSTCVTTFAASGVHTVTATYGGDGMHAGSTAELAVEVVATPDFGQIAWGWVIAFAHHLHLFGV